MRTIRLHLTPEDESEHHDLELSFEQHEVELLAKYLANCDRLEQAKIFQVGFPTVRNISWTNTEGMKFEVADFDYSHVCELLHLARPIFLSKEPASFEKTQAVFGKKSEGSALSRHLKFLRDTYERGDYQPYFQVTIHDTPLFHDTTLKAWLNGIEYHQDKDKAAVVASLEKVLTAKVARGVFISQLSGRIRATHMLAQLAKFVVSESQNGG